MAEDPNIKDYASTCEVKQIALYKVGEEDKPYVNLIGMAMTMQYHEDIFWPSYGATITVVDNQENIISTMPIEGFEKVVAEFEDVEGNQYTYNFRVWSINNRITRERRNTYTLGLISEQGLLNEGIRVNRTIKGNTSVEVGKILMDYFQIPAEMVDAEESATNIVLLPTKKTPFNVIRSLAPKTISKHAGTVAAEKAKPETKVVRKAYASKRGTKYKNVTVKTDINTELTAKATGTAGYLFFQTREKFIFRSIDNLVDNGEKFGGKPPVNMTKNKEGKIVPDPFFMQAGKVGQPTRKKIQEINFGKELNLMKKMREGAYSSICCFYNINTGEYSEQIYSLANMWSNMAHLGSKTELPAGQESLSNYPSRVMSSIISHENWYMGTGVASNDDKDGGKGDNSFPDWQKNFLTQSNSRLGILFNQELTISVTGHLELCAGDKIEVRIPNQVPDEPKEEKEENVSDPEHSGTYLVKRLNHLFNIPSKSVYTVLELVRDSTGIIE
tara:strand:+ start:4228 stop:5727 length:1500 start_codon:yes stop_codon:yes gene_type:complete